MPKTCSSQAVILKSIFAQHGIPHSLVSDYGPQFNTENFKNFLE